MFLFTAAELPSVVRSFTPASPALTMTCLTNIFVG
jgi:hypothetical protein